MENKRPKLKKWAVKFLRIVRGICIAMMVLIGSMMGIYTMYCNYTDSVGGRGVVFMFVGLTLFFVFYHIASVASELLEYA